MDEVMKQWFEAARKDELNCFDCRTEDGKRVGCPRVAPTPEEAFCQQRAYECPVCKNRYTVG